jgi:hypothetical protein
MFPFMNIYSLTLLKLLEFFMERLWARNMQFCQFVEFSGQI